MQRFRLVHFALLALLLTLNACGSGNKNTSVNTNPSLPAPLSAAPATVTTAPGQPAVFTITAQSATPPSVPIALAISGLPTGTTAAFSPTQVTLTPGTNSGTSTLTITPPVGTPNGAYPLVVRGTIGSTLFGTTQVTLNVQPAGTAQGFQLSVTPPSAAVTRNIPATFTVTVTPTGGFADTVTLSVEGGSSNLIVRSPTPASLTLNGTNSAQSTFMVSLASGVTLGSSDTLTIRAVSSTTSQTATVTVQSQP